MEVFEAGNSNTAVLLDAFATSRDDLDTPERTGCLEPSNLVKMTTLVRSLYVQSPSDLPSLLYS